MKGIYYQIQEAKVTNIKGKFTSEDLKSIKEYFNSGIIAYEKYRKTRLEEMENNRKVLIKKAKELDKDIPLELAYHCFLTFSKTYVSSDFLKKYKEWL